MTESRSRCLFVITPEDVDGLEKWAAINRIHTLSCIKSAEHGWLGASFSACELLTFFHQRVFPSDEGTSVILSKGHGAAMQYACLYANGHLTAEQLCSYKNGSEGLEAHADLFMDTGSLGQCLSTVAGMAMVSQDRRVVILGDGEIQEGQVYEALMTIAHRKLTHLTVVIDRNLYQSDHLTSEVKPISDLPTVLKGFGFAVLEIDGHNFEQISDAWARAVSEQTRPTVIIANTTKAGGTELVGPTSHPANGLSTHVWHTKVPSWSLYAEMVEEQVRKINDEKISATWSTHKETFFKDPSKLPADSLRPNYGALEGTGKAFGSKLVSLLETCEKLTIFDGDLASSGGFSALYGHPKFFEMGVSEQDMISAAGGQALLGYRPVVHTYSNFLKRGYENMFINLVQGANVIYMGTYSGLCYHTDGKSHQSINDMSVFSGLGLLCVDPLTPSHAAAVAEWAVLHLEKSVYVRLRRTPCPELAVVDEVCGGDYMKFLTKPIPLVKPEVPSKIVLVTMGTVATALALNCLKEEKIFENSSIFVVTALNGGSDLDMWREALTSAEIVVTVEDDFGALRAHVCDILAQINDLKPRVVSRRILASGPSFRTLPDCLDHFGFTTRSLAALVESSL